LPSRPDTRPWVLPAPAAIDPPMTPRGLCALASAPPRRRRRSAWRGGTAGLWPPRGTRVGTPSDQPGTGAAAHRPGPAAALDVSPPGLPGGVLALCCRRWSRPSPHPPARPTLGPPVSLGHVFAVQALAPFQPPSRGALHSSLMVLMCYRSPTTDLGLEGFYLPSSACTFKQTYSLRGAGLAVRGVPPYRPVTFYGAGFPPA